MLDGHMHMTHNPGMTEVIATDEFVDWYDSLPEGQQEDTRFVVALLEERGIRLGFPYSSEIKGTALAMRELRIQSSGYPLRAFYIFDPKRQAVLLVGGDKTGDKRFYERMVPLAEKIWAQYKKEQGL